MRIFMDTSAAQKFISTTINDQKEMYEFNDFLSIFVKGILKDIVCGIAEKVKNFFRKEDIANYKATGEEPFEKSLLWKISDYKRENLLDLIQKGFSKPGEP